MKLDSFFLSIGVVSLSLSYILFTNQQYFYLPSLLALFALALLAAVLFMFTPRLASSKNRNAYLLASVALVAAITAYETVFSRPDSPTLAFVFHVGFLVCAATAISVLGIYLTGKAMKHAKGYNLFLLPALCLILTSTFAYLAMYGFQTTNWNGVDELAYNYYSAYLFDHGVNPYTSSMQPIIVQRNIPPTVQLNGLYEYAYDYPPLSFLAFLPIPLLGITSFMVFIWLVLLISVIACFIIYWKAGRDRLLLVPIAVWLFFSYIVVGTTSHYLAMVIFVFLAYIERKRPVLSGALLGLAASTIQLAWFFIPFFFVLELREFGRDHFLKQVGASALVFIAICAYFIALSPQQTLGNIFALFGLNKLVFYGINIMQFSYAFYPVASWYSAFISVSVLVVMLALFYFYTKSLLPVIAVVPALVFFLSWRNIIFYSVSAVPLLLAVYYTASGASDIVHDKKYAAYAVIGLVAIALAAAVYSHAAYAQQQGLRINGISPVLYQRVGSNGEAYYSLGGFVANVSSRESLPQNVTFYVLSRSPSVEAYTLGSTLPSLLPDSSRNYTVDFQLPEVNNYTRLFVFAFSDQYVSSFELNITTKSPASGLKQPG